MIIDSHQHFWRVCKLAEEYHQQLEIIESYFIIFNRGQKEDNG